jgi:CTP synthase (UTP-ammonia lyase)
MGNVDEPAAACVDQPIVLIVDDTARIIELPAPPFFVVTLFVPRPQVVAGGPHPLYVGLTEAVTEVTR